MRQLYSTSRHAKVPLTLMPFEITIVREFSATHQLRLLDGTLEPLHGHNWRVRVTVAADNLDAICTVMDFHELQRLVDVVLEPMRERNVNDMPPFSTRNPSAENVALHIAANLNLPN